MSKFVFIYHAPMTPVEAAPATPEEMTAIMEQWNVWAGKVGNGLIDFGTPLAKGVRVSAGGATAPSQREVTGYSIIEAENLNAAVGLATVHPHLNMPGDCEIEVHEAEQIPGM
ncbi:YciI family protein [Paenarthrobacter histidinolovorans]|uniref:YCII-related domain-containing protein n=1 Tax=Paenarthrobacter histidinolovorans TaxID=43664 RepID=A0ABW8N3J4_9MICC